MRLDDGVGDADGTGWTAVVPVKSLSNAKSRLATDVPSAGALASAFFQDTVSVLTAATGVRGVLVATSDPEVSALAVAAGARVVSDAGHPGINAAARHAASRAPRDAGILVVVSDLPCLTPASVEAVLALASHHRTSFLPDADGTGTTMWLCGPGEAVDPRFGVGSARAHRATGAVDLVSSPRDDADVLRPARRDVDTADALRQAVALGVGPATRQLVGRSEP
jgi:2-phospho-L-lactate/phosphoenolpyruvate guanylyltransferase